MLKCISVILKQWTEKWSSLTYPRHGPRIQITGKADTDCEVDGRDGLSSNLGGHTVTVTVSIYVVNVVNEKSGDKFQC